MQWIRSHLSFANAISMIALFVALGGTTYAAVTLPKNSVGARQIKKNGVGASEIKGNAVRSSEVRANAVGASELRSNAVAGDDIADSGVGAADIADNAVGSSEIADGAVGSGEILDGSVGLADLSAAANGPFAFARIQADGTLELGVTPPLATAQHKNIAQTSIEHPATGIYCFGGLGKDVAAAMVSMDNAGAAATTTEVISVAIQRGNTLGNCDPGHQQARAVITDVDPALADQAPVNGRFNIWFY